MSDESAPAGPPIEAVITIHGPTSPAIRSHSHAELISGGVPGRVDMSRVRTPITIPRRRMSIMSSRRGSPSGEKELGIARERFYTSIATEAKLGLTPTRLDRVTELKLRAQLHSQLGSDGGTPLRSNTATPLLDIPNTPNSTDRREEMKFRRESFWMSCCGNGVIDKRAVQYYVQIGFCFMIVVFAMVKLATTARHYQCVGEDPTIYIALITTILGYIVPAPSIHS